MRKRAKMRMALLGGMIAGAVAGCWLLDVLDKLPGELRMDGINLLYCRLTRCRAQLLGLVGEEERYRNDV